MKKKKIKKPSFFVYYILGPFVYLFLKIKFGFKVKKEKIKGPALIIAPHRSYYDFLFVPGAIYPSRSLIVATTYWFRNKSLGKLFKWIGTIPKDQYRNDVRSIITMGEHFKAGHNIMLFPEGQMSPYGRPLLMPQGLDKLISKFKPNVYFVNTNGAYFISPKWGKKVARGNVISDVSLIISKEELETLPVSDINTRLHEAFNKNNDFEWIKANPRYKYIKKKKAEGLEKILLYCPKCNSEIPFKTENSTITCESCGYSLEFEKKSYNFKDNKDFNSLDDLFKHNLNKFHESIDNGLVLEDEAVIKYVDDDLNPVDFINNGKVIMDKDTIKFIDLDDQTHNLEFELSKLINFVITFNKHFEVPTPNKTYIVVPKVIKRIILYWNYINYINKDRGL